MAYKVIWTQKARKQRTETLNYGAQTFGKKLALKLRNSLREYDGLLSTNPHLGPVEPLLVKETLTFRSIVIHKHYKLVYYVDTTASIIHIVALWNTRREPQSQAQQTK